MDIQHKKYAFALSDKTKFPISSTADAILVVNGKATSTPLKNLFSKIEEIDGSKIVGFSILENIEKGKNDLLSLMEINEEAFEVSFIDKATGTPFYISSISNPIFQYSDMELLDDEVLRLVKLITQNTPETASGAGSASASEPKKVVADLQKAAPETLLPEPQDYIDGREELSKNGYEELKFKNYRLLRAPEDPTILVKILDGDFEELDVESSYPDIYEAVDEGKKIVAKVIDGKLLVE